MSVYRDYDLDALEAEYDIEATVDSLEAYTSRYEAMSAQVVEQSRPQLDLLYGPEPLQALDAFPAKSAAAPILVYIHGGYWIRGDKAAGLFPAACFNAAGAVWVAINYRLAPDVHLDDIVSDVRHAISFIYQNARRIGGDPDRLYIAGSSAGGHLTGMLLAEGWQKAHNVPANVIKGACAISGLHDLEPFLLTSQKTYLKLDRPAVLRNSPIRNLGPAGSTLLVAWGGRETAEFQRQSKAYAEACVEAGLNLETIFMAEQNHFSMTGELADPDSPLTSAILRLMRLT